MSETTTAIVERNIMSEILFRIKENIILVFIIVVMSVSAGFLYINLQKPVYTASAEVNYIAKYEGKEDDVRLSIDIMRAYVDSMVDLCTTGVMLDRADFYYGKYLKSGLSIDEFLERVKSGYYDAEYAPTSIIERDYYDKDTIEVKKVDRALNIDTFIFNVDCVSHDPEQSKDMLRIFVYATDIEGRNYFDGVKTYVYELVNNSNDISVVKGSSNVKTLLIFGMVGVGLALVVVFVKAMVDKTVKDKNELEKITGISVLSFIENQEEKKTVIKLKKGDSNGKR